MDGVMVVMKDESKILEEEENVFSVTAQFLIPLLVCCFWDFRFDDGLMGGDVGRKDVAVMGERWYEGGLEMEKATAVSGCEGSGGVEDGFLVLSSILAVWF